MGRTEHVIPEKLVHMVRLQRRTFGMFIFTVFLGCCICSFLMSCSAVVPHETYLTRTSVSQIAKVAVVVSSSDPTVDYSRANPIGDTPASVTTPAATVLAGSLVGLAAGIVVLGGTLAAADIAQHAENNSLAQRIRQHVDLSQVPDSLANGFIQPLKQAQVFHSIDHITGKDEIANRQLLASDYHAVIRLFVREISLRRDAGDTMRLRVEVRGEMRDLTSGKIVWDRREQVVADRAHCLSDYETNGLVELEPMLKTVATRLANDFVYTK